MSAVEEGCAAQLPGKGSKDASKLELLVPDDLGFSGLHSDGLVQPP